MKKIKNEEMYFKRLVKNNDLSLEDVIARIRKNDLSINDYIYSQDYARERLSYMLMKGYFIADYIKELEDNIKYEYFYWCGMSFHAITNKYELLEYLY